MFVAGFVVGVLATAAVVTGYACIVVGSDSDGRGGDAGDA